MSFTFACGTCGKRSRVADHCHGKTVKCPACDALNTLPPAPPAEAEAAAGQTPTLNDEVMCPHCWSRCAPEDLLWVAASDALVGDAVLGDDAQFRFPPARFTPAGLALDDRDTVCQLLACPRCHLTIPRDLLTVGPAFVSIVGAAASGKSYFLASMTHQLRRLLPNRFGLSFADADAASNLGLADYERILFHPEHADRLAAIPKTETHGGFLYNNALIGGRWVQYPRPFTFSVHPMERHPRYGRAGGKGRLLVLYDNAGESFSPGADTANAPVTHHVAHSQAVFFLFDPTQDNHFRSRLLSRSDDPQLRQSAGALPQALTLTEMANRVKNILGLDARQRHTAPLLVVLPKYDVWKCLLADPPETPPVATDPETGLWRLDRSAIDGMSLAIRELLRDLCPELIGAAESAWKTVRYLPVSATGCSPSVDPADGRLGFRAMDIRPQWAEVPMLYALSRPEIGLVDDAGVAPPGTGDAAEPARCRRAGNLILVERPGMEPLEVPADYDRRAVRCPHTGKRFLVPGDL